MFNVKNIMNFAIGSKIRELRIAQNLTIESFWMQLSISRMRGNNYELGKRDIPNFLIPRLADTLRVSIDELFGREVKEKVITVIPSAGSIVSVPLVGAVAAGGMEYVSEHGVISDDSILKIDPALLGNKKQKTLFDGSPSIMALTVSGDSMSPEILDGDKVIIERKPDINEYRDHDIVVAKERRDNKYTLKRFFMPDNKTKTVILLPGNKDYKPIPLPMNEVQIVGKVVLVLKTLG